MATKHEAVAGSAAVGNKRDIEIITTEIHFYKNQAGEAILEIGRRLIEAKEQLQHGEWLDWLQERVDFSEGSARRFMRIAREYTDRSPVTDLGIAKAVTLLTLPSAARDEFISEAHEVDGQAKTVDEMSKRELEQAVRERKEALEAKAKAERQAEERRAQMQKALEDAEKAQADAVRAQEEKAELERRLEELNNAGPDPDQQVLESVREEAAAAAKKETEKKLKGKISDADKARAKAEAERTRAEQELERIKTERAREEREREQLKSVHEREQAALSGKIQHLEQQLKVGGAGSQTVAVFKTHFETVQVSLNKMLECIRQSDDESTQTKLSAALGTLCKKVLEQVEQTN